jgi:glycine hydroxymethyltransferase
VFPGLQGGPHNGTTAAIAVAAHEANTEAFKRYAHAVVDNAKAMAETLLSRGISLVTGGTENHLLLADLTPKQVSGKIAAKALDRAGIVCNYNSIPFDPRKPFDPSGIRLGTPAVTSRGMAAPEMKVIANFIADVVEHPADDKLIDRVAAQVRELCGRFPAPGLQL